MYPSVTPNIKRSDIFPDYHFQVMDKHMLGGAPAGFIIVYLEGPPKKTRQQQYIPYHEVDKVCHWRRDEFKACIQARTWNDEIIFKDSGEWSYLGYLQPEIYEIYDSILKIYFYDLNDAMFFKMVWG